MVCGPQDAKQKDNGSGSGGKKIIIIIFYECQYYYPFLFKNDLESISTEIFPLPFEEQLWGQHIQ